MVSSVDVLHYVTLTTAVNEMKDPQAFVKNLVFGTDRPVGTRHVELSIFRRGRHVAPLVKRDGAALMSQGRTEQFVNVMPAHSRTKRPLSPSVLMELRRAGMGIHITPEEQSAQVREKMSDVLRELSDDVMNLEEYLSCLALRGSYTYSSADEASISVDFNRSASHTVTKSGADLWSASTAQIRRDFFQAQKLTSDDVGLAANIAIFGGDAADAFLADASGELEKNLDIRRMVSGSVDITRQLQASGALFMGDYAHGIQCWRYDREVTLPDGTSVDLIRPEYVEFIALAPAAEFVTYYGAIEDMQAIGEGNVLASKRFSKSWDEQDPSARMILLESNPLPCMRRPDATVSMKVLA